MEELFCDLCSSATGVHWCWYTPNIAPTLEEAKARDLPWFEDVGWAVCDTCHRLILAGKRESVFDRAMNTNRGMIMLSFHDGVAEKIDPEAHIRRVHASFWDYKDGTFEKVS
jgi:hypothetical protein